MKKYNGITLQQLTLQEKLGQMLIVGMEGKTVNNRLKKLILEYKVGGVIIYSRNYDNYDQMMNIIKELRELSSKNKIPLFIAVDQEGGRVNRMPVEFKNLYNAKKIASKKDIGLVKRAGDITGKMLYESGINMNFAPVLDIQRFDDKHAIGNRCYGDNKEDVSKFGLQIMNSLKDNNILPVIKHFPGHGLVKEDSHYFLPTVDCVKDEDLYPFEKAIENGADAIMVSHIIVRNISEIVPATLSRKFVYEIIRKKYRYNGLLITDDFKMRSVRYLYGPVFCIEKAIEAGYDIVMFRYNEYDENKTIQYLNKRLKQGKLNAKSINRSVSRILKVKEKYGLFNERNIQGCNIEEINKEIDSINELVNN